MTYRLEVRGVGGDMLATLFYGSDEILRREVGSLREAEKWAESAAADHKIANTPASVRIYSKTFTL